MSTRAPPAPAAPVSGHHFATAALPRIPTAASTPSQRPAPAADCALTPMASTIRVWTRLSAMTSSHSPRRDSVRVSRATSPSAWSSTTAVTYTPRPATALAALARQKHHTATRPTTKPATLIALGVAPGGRRGRRRQRGGGQEQERSRRQGRAGLEPGDGGARAGGGGHRRSHLGGPQLRRHGDAAGAGADGGRDDAEGERAAGHGGQSGRQVLLGGEVEGGAIDHAPSSRTTCGSTSASARRKSSAKSISVQRRPVTSTQPTWCEVTSMCRASSYSLRPRLSSMTRSRKRTKAGPASAPHLKKPTPSPTVFHVSGTTFLPSAITRSPRV